VRSLTLLVSATGLAGTIAALAVTAYGLDRQEPRQDPASEIRNSVPEPPASVVAKRAEPPAPAPRSELAPALKVAEEAGPEPPAIAPAPAVTPAPRAVAPSIIAIPPVDPRTLERVEPRPPLSTIAPAAPPKKPPPKPLLFRPIAEAAGTIVAGGRTITISGVGVVEDGETCARPQGGQWPCGRAARTAFRAFLRGRAVTCDFPAGEVPDKLSTTCRVGPRDIGAWLVGNGWARADGQKYEELARAAKEAGRGIYGRGPATLPPEPVFPVDAPATVPSQTPSGSDDISILPRESDPARSDELTGMPADGEPAAAPAAPDEASPGLSPLPPPSSPLR
jgi:endonuclease YncB( thermonuclease family)